MKNLFKTLLCALLVCTLLCGCSLFDSKETTEAETTAAVTEILETDAPVMEQWGPSFEAEGTQQQIAYAFISSVFTETWNEPFSCEVRTKVTKWGIDDNSEDNLIKVYLSFAVFTKDPTEADTAILNEGNVQIGKDEYEGAVILTRYCYLQKQAGSSWQCVGFGLSW